jgi:hypothetical protein
MGDMKDTLLGIGYCGLVCRFCNGCSSCREKDHELKVEDIECYHKRCALMSNLAGCWECEKFPCSEGYMFKSIRVRSFVQFIKDEGVETFMECMIKNQQNGIKYGEDNDYDKVATAEEVIGLINRGR